MKNIKKFKNKDSYNNHIKFGITPSLYMYLENNNKILDYNTKQTLPINYEQLEYIESTGSQFISMADLYGGFKENTDYGYWDVNSIYKMQIRYYIPQSPSGGQNNQASLIAMAGDYFPTLYYNGTTGVSWKFPSDSLTYFEHISPGTLSNRQVKISDYDIIHEEEITYKCKANNQSYLSFIPVLFARPLTSSPTVLNVDRKIKGRVYSFKMLKDDELIIDCIPCQDPNGEIGLYDYVNQKFIKSYEGTPFVAGRNLSNKYKLYKNRYAKLDYIENTHKAYIDLNLKLFDVDDINFDLELKFNILNGNVEGTTNKQATIFNAKYDYSNKGYPGLVIRASGDLTNSVEISAKEEFDGSYLNSNGNYSTNDLSNSTSTYNTNQIITINKHFEFTQGQRHQTSTTLFCGLDSGNNDFRWARSRIYYCHIKQNGEYVRYLIPARDLYTSQIGLFDEINNVFYPSIRQDSNFVDGPEV